MKKICIDGTYDHHYVEKVLTLSTCSAAGTKLLTCDKCGDMYTEELPLLNHRYVNGVCTMCGSKAEEQ